MREARAGDATPLYQRKALLQAMQGILALAGQRHIVLVGPEGSGKRSLVYSLAQLLAEGNGRSDIGAVVQINETALLENPLGALRSVCAAPVAGFCWCRLSADSFPFALVPNCHNRCK